jgi:hypothetical protein
MATEENRQYQEFSEKENAMKRAYVALAVALVVVGLAYWAGAADAPAAKEAGMHMEMMKDGMKDGMMGGMCPGHMMMGKMMMSCQMVAMPDGDVVVMMGTKLTKYDKNLAVIKEVEMKVDTDAMMKKMMDMCAKCPMCKSMGEREKMEMDKMGTGKMKEDMKDMKEMKP